MFRPDERTRVVEALGAVQRLGELAGGLGARRALLVSDPGVLSAGHVDTARAALEAAGVQVQVFTDVAENPTTRDVDAGLEAAKRVVPDLYVAVGGGSAIDAAKGINFLEVCGGRMADYWGHDKATRSLKPLIAVPTTAGTGSEVQSFALISDAETHRKMACGDPSAAPRVALLDAELTVTMPRRVTSMTGLDTLAHAVESRVAKPRDPATDGRSKPYATEACRLVLGSLGAVLDDPLALEARARMLRAASLAGLAIEHAMLGAAHAMANPLTQHFGVAHGLAVGLLLPHVVRFNAEDADVRAEYAELAAGCDLDGAEALAAKLGEVLALTGLPARLRDLGVERDALAMLAAGASEQWTAGFNPRPLEVGDFEGLLLAAY